jgi:hypothetical protein
MRKPKSISVKRSATKIGSRLKRERALGHKLNNHLLCAMGTEDEAFMQCDNQLPLHTNHPHCMEMFHPYALSI